ncbi:hypothetical protein LPJ66_002917 [Kickxella alabastrina]|uniref:Uncharacterized protein n=1 Tax=Kickxella alabastrina TaxID=61397 RepID=A0ACC1IMI5_9FUNG|nr:hypothetical protein LPJ66_002917 [Kickxella alabastrina]
MDAEAAQENKSPIGGRFIALLRRTQTGILFSDPLFIAHGEILPELPEGLQYIVIHPSATAGVSDSASGAQGKPYTLEAFLPKGNSSFKAKQTLKQQRPLALPVDEDYGYFSSFLPTRDSLQSSLRASEYGVLRREDLFLAETANAIDGSNQHTSADSAVSMADIDSALEYASTFLDNSTDQHTISPELLSDLGLTPTDVGLDSHLPSENGSNDNTQDETAESILSANDRLLAQLLDMQDKRAASGDFGLITDAERNVAKQLQINLARVASAHTPAALRPSVDAIHSAAKLLLAKSQGSYSGTLPPQQRYAFVTNSAANASLPPAATMAPMQTAPPPPLPLSSSSSQQQQQQRQNLAVAF